MRGEGTGKGRARGRRRRRGGGRNIRTKNKIVNRTTIALTTPDCRGGRGGGRGLVGQKRGKEGGENTS